MKALKLVPHKGALCASVAAPWDGIGCAVLMSIRRWSDGQVRQKPAVFKWIDEGKI